MTKKHWKTKRFIYYLLDIYIEVKKENTQFYLVKSIKMSIVKVVIEFIIGLACLPIAGAYAVYVANDENLSGMLGLSLVITLGVVLIGLGIIYHAVTTIFEE